ncbi:hypothetical protein BDP81DRAFT_429591 [Colletotrichum phormii]|uniref:C2H2-type domain-containing protein n=1 Tax=Colletotrichum phormii TaxID=359342 RepID=A0AAJ0EEZ3_9PEZI|nr:uncharacterized protein BDP81DRAFT_429591 [Colletotrichum phormii]KAK1636383.1 hypothetical protein BDP81DRAFT_429591 [Colletotrichum phormii]
MEFATEKELIRHHKVNHEKRETARKYTCADCGQEFTRDDNLVRHRNKTCKAREEMER